MLPLTGHIALFSIFFIFGLLFGFLITWALIAGGKMRF